MNVVALVGRLTADPQMRYTQSGIAVTNFRIAVDRGFANKQGERETDFIDVCCWNKLAESTANHLQKGRLVAVQGRLEIRSYEAQDGSKRQAAQIVASSVAFLDRPKQDTTQIGDGLPFDDNDMPF